MLSWFALISDQMSLVHYPLTGALMIGPDYFVILTPIAFSPSDGQMKTVFANTCICIVSSFIY